MKKTVIVSIYVSNSRTPKYMNQKLTIEGRNGQFSKIFGNFSTLLSKMNGITRQEIKKEITESMLEYLAHLFHF